MERRITERWSCGRKEWDVIPFASLKKGNLFRLFEPDGTPVSNGDKWIVGLVPKDSVVVCSVLPESICMKDGYELV